MTVPEGRELLARIRALPPERRREALEAAGESAVRAFDEQWTAWSHAGQLPPEGDWSVWVLTGGRGFGKTRAGAEWVSAKAREAPGARIALVAATPDEARKVMIEGRAGLLGAARHGEERRAIRWEPGLGRLTFAGGAVAFTYSGADGESLRGPEHDFAWCDELAKWKRPQATWDNLMLGLRAGERPQVLVTTTPRSIPLLRTLLEAPETVRTGGPSWANPHLSQAALAAARRAYGGTRFGRQELEGELIEDVEGALWPRALIEGRRCPPPTRDALARVVIGVDPPASADGDSCGIVACAMGADGIGYVLGDHSAAGLSPEQWGRKVAAAAEKWAADRIVAEGNQGGQMVEAVLRGAGVAMPVRRVHATVGKVRRAEPIAAFFESGEARFGGRFPELEDELAGLVVGGRYQGPGRSPDRADAMIWAMSELLLKAPAGEPRVRGL